ncbi:MAG: hypothetical protein M3R47_02060 [Chloroflexota bacterium]|nr:hypothetical protein [Chloroflexota bacterium]
MMNKSKLPVEKREVFHTTRDLFIGWWKKEYKRWTLGTDGRKEYYSDKNTENEMRIQLVAQDTFLNIKAYAITRKDTLNKLGIDPGTYRELPDRHPHNPSMFDLGVALRFEVLQLSENSIQLTAEWMEFPKLTERFESLWKKILQTFKQEAEQGNLTKKRKSTRKKNAIKLPTKPADAYKWILIWELIEPKINGDPALKLDLSDLLYYLKANELPIKEDTLRKIITLGKAKKMPDRKPFEIENNM